MYFGSLSWLLFGIELSWEYMPRLPDAFSVAVFFLFSCQRWVVFPNNHFQLLRFKNKTWYNLFRLKSYLFLQITNVTIILPLTSTPVPLSWAQTLGWTFWYLFLLCLVHCQQKFWCEGKRLSSFRKLVNFWYCFWRSLWIKIRKGTWQFHAICTSSWTHNSHISIQI